MASPIMNAISDAPPMTGPGMSMGPGPSAPGAGPGQGPDSVAEALATLNSQLLGVIEGQVPLTPEAENQLKVLLQLIQQLAQKAQGAPPPGGPGPMTPPVNPALSGPPGGGQ